jgi:hypothetical protein
MSEGIQHVAHRVAFGFEIQEPEWSVWESPTRSGIHYVSYRVAFGFEMHDPGWSGWESIIPCGIQYFPYRVVFGFQMPERAWARVVHPIDWPPRLIFLKGSNMFRIGPPSDWRYKSLSGRCGNPLFGLGSNMFRIGSFSDSRCQSLTGQNQFPR